MTSQEVEDIHGKPVGYLHVFFCFVYVVLIANIVVLSAHKSADFPAIPLLDRTARLFYDPFHGRFDVDILEGFWPGPATIFALASYGLLHFGISTAKPVEPEVSVMNSVISFFRLVFYVCMTLLLILIVFRTAIMTYHDLFQPRYPTILSLPPA